MRNFAGVSYDAHFPKKKEVFICVCVFITGLVVHWGAHCHYYGEKSIKLSLATLFKIDLFSVRGNTRVSSGFPGGILPFMLFRLKIKFLVNHFIVKGLRWLEVCSYVEFLGGWKESEKVSIVE